MLLFIPGSLFSSIGNFFLGVALLFALIAGFTLWQFWSHREAGQVVATHPPHLGRTYIVIMGVAIGMALLVAFGAYSLAQ